MLILLNLIGSLLARLSLALGARKEITSANLDAAFPVASQSWRRKILRKNYSNLGRVFFEMLYLRWASRNGIARGLVISNPELPTQAIARNNGVILLSAHLGNWEWMAMGTGIRLQTPLHVIVKNQASGRIDRFLNTMRRRFGNRLVEAGDARGAFRVLRSGEILALLGDQAAPGQSVRVPFFGRNTPTFEGPARFALRTRAALFLAENRRVGIGRYEMTFHEIAFADLPDASAENVTELTRRHTALLESIIRKQPELWLWQHNRWKYVE